MQQLSQLDGVVISQKRNWDDLFAFFNVTDKFSILDTLGNQKYFGCIRETSLLRIPCLKKLSPMKIVISNHQNHEILTIYKKIWLLRHKATVYGPGSELLGAIKSTMDVFSNTYYVYPKKQKEPFIISSKLLCCSVFDIKFKGNLIGKICRDWPGKLKGDLNDEHNFGMTFPAELDTNEKSLLLAALLFISSLHFDKKFGS